MDRRTLIVSGLVTLGASGLARAQQPLPPAQPRGGLLPLRRFPAALASEPAGTRMLVSCARHGVEYWT